MARALLLLLSLAWLSACAAGGARRPGEGPGARPPRGEAPGQGSVDEAWDRYAEALRGRLAARAAGKVGQRGPFLAGGERFAGDCSGYVNAVYAAEGVPLRALVASVAPEERHGVRAMHRTLRTYGELLAPGAPPAPGDLVFFHDTYDRNRNGRADDPLTHVGIVERVEGGTVHFLHRGSTGVVRGVMTPSSPHQARGPGGALLNTPLRARAHPVRTGGLAGALFAGYGRLAPRSLPPGLLTRPPDASAPAAAAHTPGRPDADPREAAARGATPG